MYDVIRHTLETAEAVSIAEERLSPFSPITDTNCEYVFGVAAAIQFRYWYEVRSLFFIIPT
jgi:hypothetical protein